MLELKDVSMKYNGSSSWTLKHISFLAKKGNLVVVTGESGSGKSTLASLIIRLIPDFISAEILGEILYHGTSIHNIPRTELFAAFGYVPQYPADYTTTMVVEEEIVFPLENLGLSREEISIRLNDVLKELEISHLRHRLLLELSSGELQKIALAAALVTSPKILILDEPMARIDPRSEIKLATKLKSLARKGILVIAFEHRLDYLLAEADMVIVLKNGRITNIGSPKEVVSGMKDVDIPEISTLIVGTERSYPLAIDEAIDIMKNNIELQR
ncbi:MAG: ABC transporter ATP-binding protein [Candidatus Heimdallarchaeota archaeon]